MLCRLCNKNQATGDYRLPGLHGLLCESCSKQHPFRLWQCRVCQNIFAGGKRYINICGNCVRPITCHRCDTRIKNPTRRNYDADLCEKCLVDLEEVAFGDRQSSVKYAKIGSRRSFGVELETSYSPNLESVIRNTQWGFYEDGSVSGMEFTSPPLSGNAGYKSIQQFCRLARKNKYKVDVSCGFHLHIDITDLTVKQVDNLCLAYHLTYPAWKSLVARSRHANEYCEYSKDWLNPTDINIKHYRNKFTWVSLGNLYNYGTVEIRLHAGTLCFQKIINWIRAHVKFVDWIKRRTTKEITDLFIQDWLIDDDTNLYRKLRKIWTKRETKRFMNRRRHSLCHD